MSVAGILAFLGGNPQQSGVLAPRVKVRYSLVWNYLLSQDNMLRGCRNYIWVDFSLLQIKDFSKNRHG